MNDKKLQEFVSALDSEDLRGETLKAIKSKIVSLKKQTDDYDKAKGEHKEAFLALSKETTKSEKLAASLEGREAKLDLQITSVELDKSIVLQGEQSLEQRKTEFDAFEKKSKASIKRKESLTSKALAEASALKKAVDDLKGKFEAKIAKLKAAIDG